MKVLFRYTSLTYCNLTVRWWAGRGGRRERVGGETEKGKSKGDRGGRANGKQHIQGGTKV